MQTCQRVASREAKHLFSSEDKPESLTGNCNYPLGLFFSEEKKMIYHLQIK